MAMDFLKPGTNRDQIAAGVQEQHPGWEPGGDGGSTAPSVRPVERQSMPSISDFAARVKPVAEAASSVRTIAAFAAAFVVVIGTAFAWGQTRASTKYVDERVAIVANADRAVEKQLVSELQQTRERLAKVETKLDERERRDSEILSAIKALNHADTIMGNPTSIAVRGSR